MSDPTTNLPNGLQTSLVSLTGPPSGPYTFATLPPAASVPPGTIANTTDQGPVYSNGTIWIVLVGTASSIIYTPGSTGLPGTVQGAITALAIPTSPTANEIAAAISITSIGYNPGDLRRYGVDFNDDPTKATSNTAILNAIGAAGWVSDITLYWPPGICRINDTVTFGSIRLSHFFDNRSEVDYYGTADRAAMVFGNSSTSQGSKEPIGGAGLVLLNKTIHAWTNEAFIGAQVLGTMQNSTCTWRTIDGFTINLQLRPSTNGIAYNTFFLGILSSAKVNIDIHSFAANQFVNENLFLNGSFRAGTLGNTNDSYGVRFIAEVGAYRDNSRNIFIKPSFELGNAAGATLREPVLYSESGSDNWFRDARVETGRGYVVDVSATLFAVNKNRFQGSILSGVFTANIREPDAGLSYGNSVSNTSIDPGIPLDYRSGDLVTRAFCTDVAKISVKGCFLQNSGSSTETYAGTASIFKDYITIPNSSNAVGVYVDTSIHKSFVVQKDFKQGFGGRTAVVCYNAAGVVLTGSDTGQPFVNGASSDGTNLLGAATYGYRYVTVGDDTGPIYFKVGSLVDHVKVLFFASAVTMYLRSFVIYALPSTSLPPALRVYTNLPQSDNDWYATAAPDSLLGGGFVAAGQFILNASASAGQWPGWMCVTAGYLARAWAASTAVIVNQMVNNDTGKTYVCLTAGTTAGSGGPTGTATSGITDGTAVWGYIGTQAVFSNSQDYSRQTPTTGFTITIGNGVQNLVLVPAGTLASGTITMPASPRDGQVVRVSSSQIITSLTVSPNSGQTILNAPTTLTAGAGFGYIYNLANTQWDKLY